MEVVNITPEKFMSILTRVGVIVAGLLFIWRFPDILAVVLK